MMRSCGIAILIGALSCLAVVAKEPTPAANVKQAADAVLQAMLRRDYGYVVDRMPDEIFQLVGRDDLLKLMKEALEQTNAEAFILKSAVVGDPTDLMTEDSNTFTIIPTTVDFLQGNAQVVVKSYLWSIREFHGWSAKPPQWK